MTIIAASIVSKNGDILLSRQFCEISKSQISQYLSCFFCCMDGESQHTFFDGEYIRYVYQPLGLLYMVLLTTLNSNIFEDLESIRLFSRVVNHYCYPVNEETIRKRALTLIFSFDEMVSLGFREPVTMEDIDSAVEMRSENEILAEIVKKDRENQAKEIMKRKAKEFDMEKKLKRQQERLAKKNSHRGGIFGSPLVSLASNLLNNLKGSSHISVLSNYNDVSLSSNISNISFNNVTQQATLSNYSTDNYLSKSVKSLSLKNRSTQDLNVHKTIVSDLKQPKNDQKEVSLLEKTNQNLSGYMVSINLNESIYTVINRNGQLDQYEVTGIMTINIANNEYSNVKLKFSKKPNSKLTLQTHPNIDKKLFLDDSVLAIKEGGRSYPLNNDVGVLKWRYQSQNLDDMILSINTWVDKTSESNLNIIIDLELNDIRFSLENIFIKFDLSPQYYGTPNVINISDGRYFYNKNIFTWELSLMDSTLKNTSIELSLDNYNDNVDSLYPFKCSFISKQLLLDSEIQTVTNNDITLQSDDLIINSSLTTNIYDVV